MVGIALSGARATVVACDGESDGKPRIVAWEALDFASVDDLGSALQTFVANHKLNGWPVRCALSEEQYSLRLVERPPNVPDEELAEATRWLVQDLIEFDVESAALATLTIPEDAARARTSRMFVIAGRHDPLSDLAHAISDSGLSLSGFETPETVMVALETRLPEVVAGSALLRIEEKASLVTLSQEGHLFLARNMHVDIDSIEDIAQNATEAEEPAGFEILQQLDPLLLDVQRSLDYYESEYGRAPASRLVMMPSRSDLSPLVPALSEALRPMQIESFDLERFFDFAEPPPSQILPSLTLAAGCAVANKEGVGDALVPGSLKKKSAGLDLFTLLRVAALLGVVFCIYAGVTAHWLGREKTQLAQLEAQRSETESQVEGLLEQAAVRAAAASPEERLAQLRSQRDARLAMLRDIGTTEGEALAPFSELLLGLARQDTPGVWLERIALRNSENSVALEGRSLSPEDLPIFLRQLGDESGYADRRFRTFQMNTTDDDKQGIAFKISSTADESEEGAARP
ncbi:MAG: PilN domain-containing protein [Myxococcota bacterium]